MILIHEKRSGRHGQGYQGEYGKKRVISERRGPLGPADIEKVFQRENEGASGQSDFL